MKNYGNSCKICGTTISKKAKKCQKHSGMLDGPITNKLPSDQEILRMVEKTSQAQVAKKLGVNITTIKKIMLKYRK